jgi:hypothetical protein
MNVPSPTVTYLINKFWEELMKLPFLQVLHNLYDEVSKS